MSRVGQPGPMAQQQQISLFGTVTPPAPTVDDLAQQAADALVAHIDRTLNSNVQALNQGLQLFWSNIGGINPNQPTPQAIAAKLGTKALRVFEASYALQTMVNSLLTQAGQQPVVTFVPPLPYTWNADGSMSFTTPPAA